MSPSLPPLVRTEIGSLVWALDWGAGKEDPQGCCILYRSAGVVEVGGAVPLLPSPSEVKLKERENGILSSLV